MDLSTEAHTVKFTDAQRCVACKNRLVEHVPGFFCQLTHPLQQRDGANLNLADHAWLGERVHEHRLRHRLASNGCENSAVRRLIFLIIALVEEKCA